MHKRLANDPVTLENNHSAKATSKCSTKLGNFQHMTFHICITSKYRMTCIGWVWSGKGVWHSHSPQTSKKRYQNCANWITSCLVILFMLERRLNMCFLVWVMFPNSLAGQSTRYLNHLPLFTKTMGPRKGMDGMDLLYSHYHYTVIPQSQPIFLELRVTKNKHVSHWQHMHVIYTRQICNNLPAQDIFKTSMRIQEPIPH